MKLSYLFCIAALVCVLQAVPLTNNKFVFTKNDVSEPVKWTNCSKAGDPATVENVVFVPDPPQKGKPLQVIATVNLKETVTGGKINVNFKADSKFIPPLKQEFDLCKAVGSCPVNSGSQKITITDTIPRLTPSGHYEGNVIVTDQDNKELACINMDMHI